MRLMPSWASASRNEGQSAYAAAMPMLAAAGIVVTEISRPITAPDLAVEEKRPPRRRLGALRRLLFHLLPEALLSMAATARLERPHRNDAKMDHGVQSSHCKIGCTSPNAIALQNVDF